MMGRRPSIAAIVEAFIGEAFGFGVWLDGVGVWWSNPRTGARALHAVNGARARARAVHRRIARLRRRQSFAAREDWRNTLVMSTCWERFDW